MQNPVVVISGASSGLGRAAATHLAARGYRVIGGGRRFPDPSLPFETHRLDVCDGQSVERFVARAVEQAGRIDALVNCAGISLSGALEVMSLDEAQRIFDTNLLGTVRMCREVLPLLRGQREGRIVNVSSLAGLIALPFQAAYTASKYAVEGLTECLRHETRPFGIHVSLLEPGDFLTGMTEHYEWSALANGDTVYAERARRAIAIMEADCRKSSDLAAFSLRLESILRSRRPRLRYSVGMPIQRFAAVLRRFIPDSWMEWIIRTTYRLG
jgi:NAD(P)-dependent dehydrogenase (short-subunit alcohol dehydrogenase family)